MADTISATEDPHHDWEYDDGEHTDSGEVWGLNSEETRERLLRTLRALHDYEIEPDALTLHFDE